MFWQQYGEFNASDITGPTYGSLGMESGRNYLRYCPTTQLDMSIARRIRIRERFRLEFRGGRLERDQRRAN